MRYHDNGDYDQFLYKEINSGDLESAKAESRIMWKSLPEGFKQVFIVHLGTRKNCFYADNFAMLRNPNRETKLFPKSGPPEQT